MSALTRLRDLYAALPDGGSVVLTREAIAELLACEEERVSGPQPEPAAPAPQTWRERLWTAAADTRLTVEELMEATGRSRDWVYRAKDPKWAQRRGSRPLPYARLDGQLVFRVGDLREWLRAHEERFNDASGEPAPLRVVSPRPR